MPAMEEPQNFVLKMWQNGFSIDEELIETTFFFKIIVPITNIVRISWLSRNINVAVLFLMTLKLSFLNCNKLHNIFD